MAGLRSNMSLSHFRTKKVGHGKEAAPINGHVGSRRVFCQKDSPIAEVIKNIAHTSFRMIDKLPKIVKKSPAHIMSRGLGS
jgi:hypothetical protein